MIKICISVWVLMSAVALTACDQTGSGGATTKTSAQNVSSSTAPDAKPANYESTKYPAAIAKEAGAIAAHPGHAARHGFVLTLSHDGAPIASFEDRYNDHCTESCGQYSYAGVYALKDPASGRLTDYDHVSAAYSEDTDELLVDRDGRLFFVGFDNALTSPSKTFLASSDQNLNGDGRLTIVDWISKSVWQFIPPKSLEGGGYFCLTEQWTPENHLRVLCQLHGSHSASEADISRDNNGRWTLRETLRYASSNIVEDDTDDNAFKLKAGAKGTPALNPVNIFATTTQTSEGDLPGYRRLAKP